MSNEAAWFIGGFCVGAALMGLVYHLWVLKPLRDYTRRYGWPTHHGESPNNSRGREWGRVDDE